MNAVLCAIGISVLALKGHSELRAQQAQDSEQHSSHTQTSDAPVRLRLPVAVNGAETPERIPDDLAYRHFLMSASVHANGPTREVGRRDAVLVAMGLADEDKEALIAALKGFREAIDAVAAERRTLTRESLNSLEGQARVGSLRMRDQQITEDAKRRVISALSADGRNVLDRHLRDRIKRTIVVYGDQP